MTNKNIVPQATVNSRQNISFRTGVGVEALMLIRVFSQVPPTEG